MVNNVADQRARQGGRGRPVLAVLVGSLVLLGIVMVVLMSWNNSKSSTDQQATSRPAASSGASSSNASRVPTENPAYPAPASPTTGTAGNPPPSR